MIMVTEFCRIKSKDMCGNHEAAPLFRRIIAIELNENAIEALCAFDEVRLGSFISNESILALWLYKNSGLIHKIQFRNYSAAHFYYSIKHSEKLI